MKSPYKRHRFPREVISYAVGLFHRFTPSFRDVEELLAERGVSVSYEAIRSWCMKFGLTYARLRRKQGRHGHRWHVDELVKRSGASATTGGGWWIRMETSLIFWSPSAETVERLNDSFSER